MGTVPEEQEMVRYKPYEMVGHDYLDCKCDRVGCMFCDGGLAACTICGGLEGSLLPTCPGRMMTAEESDQAYSDYCNGTGPYAGLVIGVIP